MEGTEISLVDRMTVFETSALPLALPTFVCITLELFTSLPADKCACPWRRLSLPTCVWRQCLDVCWGIWRNMLERDAEQLDW